ncbi:hypothetical protein [Arthrobacter sp. TE12232]
MTKPDPGMPDPETPDPETPAPDPADPGSPGGRASKEGGVSGSSGAAGERDPAGAHSAGPLPPHGSDAHVSQPPESPGSPAAGALSADDDAVWLDLVARLEGVGEGGPESLGGDTHDGGGPSSGGTDGTGGSPGTGARTFRDFDPLGLAGTAPIELSAAERLAPAPGQPTGGIEVPEAASGPRDYEPEDDDGAFVPEEPPSLAGSDPMTVLAWLGAVGGPIALVLSAMFWRSAPMLAILGMVVAFAASVVFLIMKLPGEKDEHDDGARV